MKQHIKFGIVALLAVMLLMSMVFVPAVSAKKNTSGEVEGNITEGNVTTKGFVADASLTVNPYQGVNGSEFHFEGDATFEADVYGIPLPEVAWFANDISYDGFKKPEVTSTSSSVGFVYKSNTAIGEAWTHRYPIYIFGGPTTKHVYSDAIAKNTGRYNNRQYAGLTLVRSDACKWGQCVCIR